MKSNLEKECLRNGMTIKSKSKGYVKLNESIQEALLSAPVLKLQDLHNKYGDDFICHDGRIIGTVTI